MPGPVPAPRPAWARIAVSICAGDLGMLLEIRLGVLAPLADALAVVGEPRAGFLDHAGAHAEVEQLAGLGDALAVHDVELDHPERRRHLVLDHLDPGLVADHLVAVLDLADAADVEAHRGVELERVAAGRGLGIAEHHADLLADLVGEDHDAVRAAGCWRSACAAPGSSGAPAGPCAESPISPSSSARGTSAATLSITTTSIAPRAHQGVGDLERLLAGVGLRDQQLVDVDAELSGVAGIERVLGVDEGADAARLLRLGDAVQGERGLARGFRARRSRRCGRAAGRRRRARGRGRASRWRWCRSRRRARAGRAS